ncbi:hypothetical protein BT63DRAFT_449909 [Microthyrium microscopicum]|uniref:F-box domain-containing protein n=1 Tax=Microthyrium microscopicum TaxID=703497 RepID=A0A6A6UV15_9PEZI|nr:hypothetical protein BT63DRAFT_449909 [Microthyrium microscopicum]
MEVSAAPTLTTLPAEIILLILHAIPNRKDLFAATLTCHHIRSIFLESESAITWQILKRELDDDTYDNLGEAALYLETAYWADQADRQENWPTYVTCRLPLLALSPRCFPVDRWTLREAEAMCQFNLIVVRWTDEFIARAHWKMYEYDYTEFDEEMDDPEERYVKPNDQETARIYRAFWRYQIYCNVFHPVQSKNGVHDCPIGMEHQQALFFNHFLPWEIEQIACVEAFVYSEVSRNFNYMLQEPENWTDFKKHTECRLGLSHLDNYYQRLLSFGLDECLFFVYWEPPIKAMVLPYANQECPEELYFFLSDALLFMMEAGKYGRKALSEMSRDEEAKLFPTSLIPNDNDPGPEKAWRLMVRDRLALPDFTSRSVEHSRHVGYVFWDEKTAKKLDFMTWEKRKRTNITRSEYLYDIV